MSDNSNHQKQWVLLDCVEEYLPSFSLHHRELVYRTLHSALTTMNAKNADYGDSWRSEGAKGIYVRLRDKTARLRNLLWLGKAANVNSEAVTDTLEDLLNYSILGRVAIYDDNLEGF